MLIYLFQKTYVFWHKNSLFFLFTTAGYVWPWKGGAAKGKAVESFYNVFPIPSDDIGSNTNLKQNEGY